MTSEYIRDMLQESVKDPIALSDLLNIRMTPTQRTLLKRVALATKRVDVEAHQNGDEQRAALLALFWRTLRTAHSTGLILARTREERRSSMEFILRIRNQHHALQAVTHFREPHWWRCEFGFRPDWQIIAPTAIPEQLAAIKSDADHELTVLVLGSRPEMLPAVEMATALAEQSPSSLVIQLW